jgi:hypothetical protein
MVTYPFAITYAGTGDYDAGPAGMGKGLHTLITDMHVARQPNLALAVKLQHTLLDDFANDILSDPTLGGTVDTITTGEGGPALRYRFVMADYTGIPTWLLRWELRVKIQNTIT